jgi:hypothetical protein
VTTLLKATVASTAVILFLAAPGAWFGLLYAGWASVMASAFTAVLFMWMTQNEIGFQWNTLRAALLKSGLVALCAAIAPAAAWMLFGARPEEIVEPIAAGILGGTVGFIAAVFLFRHPIREELMLLWGKVHALRSV